MRYVFVLALLLCFQTATANELPRSVLNISTAPLEKVGAGTYRKLGFTVYKATLWAPEHAWTPKKPYALQLKYKMSLSQSTMMETIMDNIREQNVADEAKLEIWQRQLGKVLNGVKANDEIVCLYNPGQPSQFFLNSKKIADIKDQKLSKAFFNIWLGDGADEDLQAQLLARK
jgi:hypothetical protein